MIVISGFKKGGKLKTNRQQYLNSIRENTAYPTYRGIIGIITIIFYILAVLTALSSLVGITMMGDSVLAGLGTLISCLLFAVLTFLGGRFFKEGALMLADIADSITDVYSQDFNKMQE